MVRFARVAHRNRPHPAVEPPLRSAIVQAAADQEPYRPRAGRAENRRIKPRAVIGREDERASPGHLPHDLQAKVGAPQRPEEDLHQPVEQSLFSFSSPSSSSSSSSSSPSSSSSSSSMRRIMLPERSLLKTPARPEAVSPLPASAARPGH